MKKIFVLFLLFAGIQMAVAQTSPKQEIENQLKLWHEGLVKGDLDGIMAQYASDAVFFPTFINMAKNADERKAFLQTLINKKPTAVMNPDQRIRLFTDVATCSGTWIFDVNNADGVREKKPVRYLFVFEKRNGKWLIIEQHVSAFPEKK